MYHVVLVEPEILQGLAQPQIPGCIWSVLWDLTSMTNPYGGQDWITGSMWIWKFTIVWKHLFGIMGIIAGSWQRRTVERSTPMWNTRMVI